MKKCPFCAEEIQDEAIKCKHCGEMLNQEAAVAVATQQIVVAQAVQQRVGRPPVNALAGLLSFAGVWAMLYGASQWIGGHDVQAQMAAGGAGEFSKPMTSQAMSSGGTYAAIGLGLFLFAAFVQTASNQSHVAHLASASPALPVEVSSSSRAVAAGVFATVAGLVVWIGFLVANFKEGQSMFLGLVAALLSGAIGYWAAPAMAAAERTNPSGFRIK